MPTRKQLIAAAQVIAIIPLAFLWIGQAFVLGIRDATLEALGYHPK